MGFNLINRTMISIGLGKTPAKKSAGESQLDRCVMTDLPYKS